MKKRSPMGNVVDRALKKAVCAGFSPMYHRDATGPWLNRRSLALSGTKGTLPRAGPFADRLRSIRRRSPIDS